MSSYNYSSSSYTPQKGMSYSYSRPSTSSTTYSSTSTSSSSSSYSASSSTYQSLCTYSALSSSRSKRYSKPPVIHNGGGQINDPNTSTSAPNGGYYN